jgi:NOL1/NOP2/fmu family ribosome biogenesis protein
LRQRESVLYGWPDDAPVWVDELAIGGPELAHRVGQTWKPAHAAALRRVPRARSVAEIEINDEQAKAFLRGESIPCEGNGWSVARWRGRPLGWFKISGSVGKNHLPKPARMPGELNA